jgi:2-haloacid dehalogenase
MTAAPALRTLPGVDAIVFDLVGTLVDEFGTVSRSARHIFGENDLTEQQADRVATQWLQSVRASRRGIADQDDEYVPEPEIRRRTLRAVLEEEHVRLPERAFDALLTISYRLSPWPGVADELGAIAEFVLVAGLTNAALEQAVQLSAHARLRWHALLSTETARTYKPAPAAYRLLIDRLGLEPGRTLFVAAHPWDLRGAASLGFHTAHLARPHTTKPTADDHFDLQLESLEQLTEALRSRSTSAS